MTRRRKARQLVRAMKEAEFDWDEHNRRMDEQLTRWNEAARRLSELHIETARDLRSATEDMNR